jgi:DNA-binding MurR/RpiR family transcriptional regulator
MPHTSCIIKIHEAKNSFSAKEAQIADFILQHPQSSVYPTIEELAEQIGVSEATPFSICTEAGLFRIPAIQNCIGNRYRQSPATGI